MKDEKFKKQIDEIIEYTSEHFNEITTIAEAQRAESLIVDVVRELKTQVEKTFDPIIKKQREALKEAQGQKNKFYTPLEEVEEKVREALKNHLLKFPDNQKKLKHTFLRDSRPTVVVTDIEKVPKEFLVVDTKKVLDYLKVHVDKTIPGIEIKKEKTIVIATQPKKGKK